MKSNFWLGVGLSVLLVSSCDSYKNVPYFQDLQQVQTPVSVTLNAPRVTVEPGDKLLVLVSSARTPEQAVQFNLPKLSVTSGSVGTSTSGLGTDMAYTVDSKGNLDMPLLGKMRVAGMTREEVAKAVQDYLLNNQLLRDAIVTAEVINHHVNVIGEVNRPGRVDFSRDNLTVLEAISLAGDLTIFGERQNVLVIRQDGNKQTHHRLDLTNIESVYASPVYQLKQNDLIYVQPNVTKQRQSTPMSNTWQNPGIYMSLTSMVLSIAVLVLNLTNK